MRFSIRLIFFFFTVNLYTCSDMNVEWKDLMPLPPTAPGSDQPGIAGPFAGIHNDTFIIAGGANFEGAMPWDGGTKSYHNELYQMALTNDKGHWINGGSVASLPLPVAYGTSVSIPDGIVCMGGETEKGLTDTAFLISVNRGNIVFTPLPSLPVPLSNSACTAIGRKVYIAGGLSADGPSSALFCIDIENSSDGWKRLADVPLAMINSVMTAAGEKEKCLYLLGGRTREKESDTSVIRAEIFRYCPVDNKWYLEGMLADGTMKISLAAGTGATVENTNILIFGGNDGTVFNKVEKIISAMQRERDSVLLAKMKQEYKTLQETHPGFSRVVIKYNIKTKTCRVIDSIPGPAQVTTTAVTIPNGILIPSGEIKPGIRTTRMLLARIK